jgi:predicted GNAT family N-acyltransferase
MYITKVIKYNSKEYEEELILRNEVLREPIEKVLDTIDISNDEYQIHIGAFLDNHIVGCILIDPIEVGVLAKLRQLAVASSMQGNGIGKKLMTAAEFLLKEDGYRAVELSARVTAEKFYKKLGYRTIGTIFYDQDIQHIKMVKII